MDEAYIDSKLATSQDEMVAIFSECTTAEELFEKVKASNIQDDLKEWLLSCTPEMLETAARLVTKWGSTDPEDGVGLS